MNRRVISLCLSVSLMLLFAGCSGKKVASSSGDQSAQSGQAKSEAIQPDAIKPVPTERSFEPSSVNQPSNLSSPGSDSLSNKGSDSNPLGDVFFDYDQFQIRKDAVPVLDSTARWIRAEGSKTVLIEGHCDERGTLAYNLVLGEKRARAAKKYLQDLGVRASQLQITSYGETQPVCKQQNEDCYQQNRRAHFVAK